MNVTPFLVQNYFLLDKYLDAKLIKCYAHCTHNAMFTGEMTILKLDFCERDVCPSTSHSQLSHSQFFTLDFDNNHSV